MGESDEWPSWNKMEERSRESMEGQEETKKVYCP